MTKKLTIIVPDTSVLIDKALSVRIKKDEIAPVSVLVHMASLAELEHQANENRTIGKVGLDEIKELRELGKQKGFNLEFIGVRPRAAEIQHAALGEVDALIRQAAMENDATLVTSDKVQAAVAEAQGIDVIYFEPAVKTKKKIKLDSYFDEQTMSVHIRENIEVMAKKGFPGSWKFESVGKVVGREEVQEIAYEILEQAKIRKDGFIEIERLGSSIVQLGDYRIVIIRPPFGDGWEITAVRPVKKLDLNEYSMSEKLRKRLIEQAEGILIAGRPGEGKSTFARALAEYYAANGKVVKTVEAPRDMLLSDNITQYSISKGTADEVHDVLLLSRPDNTIFDEMRNTKDFELFTDLRLAGIGMAGVVHATRPIDAVQRFLGRIELGVIPHVIDTVVFIKSGAVDAVLSLSMTVKVPSGMMEADLARPVVEVHDFDSSKLAYEIYSYGEQTVVIPVTGSESRKPVHMLAEEAVKRKMQKYVERVEVEVIGDNKVRVYVPEHEIARLIGKEGKNIEMIEKEIGVGIDVEELKQERQKKHEHVNYDVDVRKNVTFFLEKHMEGRDVEIYYGDEMLAMVKVGRKAIIKFRRESPVGQKIVRAIGTGKIRLLTV